MKDETFAQGIFIFFLRWRVKERQDFQKKEEIMNKSKWRRKREVNSSEKSKGYRRGLLVLCLEVDKVEQNIHDKSDDSVFMEATVVTKSKINGQSIHFCPSSSCHHIQALDFEWCMCVYVCLCGCITFQRYKCVDVGYENDNTT